MLSNDELYLLEALRKEGRGTYSTKLLDGDCLRVGKKEFMRKDEKQITLHEDEAKWKFVIEQLVSKKLINHRKDIIEISFLGYEYFKTPPLVETKPTTKSNNPNPIGHRYSIVITSAIGLAGVFITWLAAWAAFPTKIWFFWFK